MIRAAVAVCAAAMACAGAASHRPGSMVDALARGGGDLETAAPPGSFVSAYRTFLRPILASQCPWSPSDSEFLVRGMQACGVVPATYAAVARLLEEPDISWSRRVYALDGGRIRWFSSELRCER